MEAKGYWTSSGDKTPHATLYSAILRDLTKGDDSKFMKTERGRFTIRGENMRSKDVRNGERSVACHSGKTIVVKVESTFGLRRMVKTLTSSRRTKPRATALYFGVRLGLCDKPALTSTKSGMTKKSKESIQRIIRCEIYTRKSCEERLDQDFNSLHAQRESAESFIKSQQNEGWECLPNAYDDGGYSGGSVHRLALEQLIADIKAGKIDCVVVYKVDRLSRSLLDVAQLMALFEENDVSFVSVTQQFNTTHSMGRLTLNFLLSFAQFEREIIGERIRDKLAALCRKGKWIGGHPVLGYEVDRSNPSPKLVVNAEEASQEREIFQLYLQHQTLTPVLMEINDRR